MQSVESARRRLCWSGTTAFRHLTRCTRRRSRPKSTFKLPRRQADDTPRSTTANDDGGHAAAHEFRSNSSENGGRAVHAERGRRIYHAEQPAHFPGAPGNLQPKLLVSSSGFSL